MLYVGRFNVNVYAETNIDNGKEYCLAVISEFDSTKKDAKEISRKAFYFRNAYIEIVRYFRDCGEKDVELLFAMPNNAKVEIRKGIYKTVV